MKTVIFLIAFCFIATNTASHADEIDYKECHSIQDVITRETQEIMSAEFEDHDELAQLYVARGESYLLDAQYEKAIEDFYIADLQSGYMNNVDNATMVRFRSAFGKAVSYDNLRMQQQTQLALNQLQAIASHFGCRNCAKETPSSETTTLSISKHHFQKMIGVYGTKKTDRSKLESQNYDDILGPDSPPSLNWCEEVVTGVGRAMDAIACLAPNYGVKIVLIGVIESLITRGVKCCQTGGFWKACVAPITRKWQDWKSNKEKNSLPSEQNLPLYTN